MTLGDLNLIIVPVVVCKSCNQRNPSHYKITLDCTSGCWKVHVCKSCFHNEVPTWLSRGPVISPSPMLATQVYMEWCNTSNHVCIWPVGIFMLRKWLLETMLSQRITHLATSCNCLLLKSLSNVAILIIINALQFHNSFWNHLSKYSY